MITAKEQKETRIARTRRKNRVRARIHEHATVRLSVHRSNVHISAQIIDDVKQKTIAASSDTILKVKGTKTERAQAVGADIAKKAKTKKITRVVFDRGWYHYHGRVRALAEAALASGLQFTSDTP